MKKNTLNWKYVPLAFSLIVILLAGACAPAVAQVQAPAMGHDPEDASASATPAAEGTLQVTRGANPALGKPDVTFTLKTGMSDGKLTFIGVGGDLDGKINPDLQVTPGQVVQVTLQDADGMLHDLVLPDLGVGTEQVSPKLKESSLTFKADKEGTYAYFCSVPGHRQAGMEGRLVVGKAAAAAAAPQAASVVRAPDDLPGPITRSTSETVRVDLETVEVQGQLADGVTYTYWTFNGKVPGPMIRVRVGDTVEVHLKNSAGSSMNHSVDLHAVTGPGGGAVATQTKPGEETMFSFKALNPGLYVYHCATPMVAQHIANGMYGMILVEPEGGLPKVDREFYIMQGEIYTTEKMGMKGNDTFSTDKLLDERPEYFVLNGAVGALTTQHPLKAHVGETIRIFYGVGGPNFTSSFHMIGEIFDRVYNQGSLTSAPLTNVQTTLVPAGGATVVELQLQVPGRFILVDHSLSRMERGLAGYLLVDGDPNPEIFSGTMTPGSGH
jgi:nitrite reductase (NO-forming)